MDEQASLGEARKEGDTSVQGGTIFVLIIACSFKCT